MKYLAPELHKILQRYSQTWSVLFDFFHAPYNSTVGIEPGNLFPQRFEFLNETYYSATIEHCALVVKFLLCVFDTICFLFSRVKSRNDKCHRSERKLRDYFCCVYFLLFLVHFEKLFHILQMER